jgi:two-component system, cell cycle response regulator DivK
MNVHRNPSAFEAHEAPTLRGRSRASKSSIVDTLVLVVDDDENARDLWCATLEHLGYRTIHRQNGLQAIDAARQHVPDVLLMDVRMPVLGGLETTRRLKEDSATRGCFVVLMTASGSDHFDEGLRAGCDGFLCKPFNPFVLGEIIGARRRDADPSIVKRCGCGATYTRSQWKALPFCGPMLRAELRNCICGSSLALARGDLGAAHR